MKKTILLGFSLIFSGVAMADQLPQREVQYFEGNIVTSSLDGSTVYGPPVSALVYRVVDPQKDRVIEIVHQRWIKSGRRHSGRTNDRGARASGYVG